MIPSGGGDRGGTGRCNWPEEESRGRGVVGVDAELNDVGRTRAGSYDRTRLSIPSSSCDWSGVEKHFCYPKSTLICFH